MRGLDGASHRLYNYADNVRGPSGYPSTLFVPINS